MKTIDIDHTAIAVQNLDEAIDRYRLLLGIAPMHREVVLDQGVEVAFFAPGSSQIELISPVSGEGGVARFLQARGEALHHIGVLVQDIQQELFELARQNVELIDSVPRRGVHGLVAFIHPRGTGGVLIELVQSD